MANRAHKCPLCGRKWKHHKSGQDRCQVRRQTADAWANAIKHGYVTT